MTEETHPFPDPHHLASNLSLLLSEAVAASRLHSFIFSVILHVSKDIAKALNYH